MIVTECPHCDVMQLYTLNMGQSGVFVLHTCDGCGEEFVVEATRVDGTTYPKTEFEDEVLPDIDGFEKCVHPDGDTTLYCEPEKLRWQE